MLYTLPLYDCQQSSRVLCCASMDGVTRMSCCTPAWKGISVGARRRAAYAKIRARRLETSPVELAVPRLDRHLNTLGELGSGRGREEVELGRWRIEVGEGGRRGRRVEREGRSGGDDDEGRRCAALGALDRVGKRERRGGVVLLERDRRRRVAEAGGLSVSIAAGAGGELTRMDSIVCAKEGK